MKRTLLIVASFGFTVCFFSTLGSAQSCAPPWSATTTYSSPGQAVSENGVNFKNNWWTQGDDPATHNGGPGSGQPWTSTGNCGACTTVPTVPTGLTAPSTTSCSATLTWTASTVPANCNAPTYSVTKNGMVIASNLSGTSFTVPALSPSTTFSFAVLATDKAGPSNPSAALNVTTHPGSCGPVGTGGKLFAPYIDMGLGASENVVATAQAAGLKGITLAFLVSSGNCNFGWGGVGGTLPTDNLPNGTSMQTVVQQLQANGMQIIISFGGAVGSITGGCTSASALQSNLQQVISRYNVKMLDFDMEASDTLGNGPGLQPLDQALKALKTANPGLTVSYTLPVEPFGLINTGLAVLQQAHADNFNPDVINVMAMDYGSANDNNGQMGLDATLAAQNTHNQVQTAGLTSSIGVTPMAGVNDGGIEVFQLADANTLLNFAESNSYITRIALWSFSRDNGSCPTNPGFAQATCSGISQSNFQFSQTFEAFQ